MTTHANLLAMIAATWPERVPKGVSYWSEDDDRQYGSSTGPGWIVDNDGGEFVSDDYDGAAFAIIEKAAWGVVRWWCSNNGFDCLVSDGKNHDDGLEVTVQDELGSGPTDADALLAALKYIAGEIAKEKK